MYKRQLLTAAAGVAPAFIGLGGPLYLAVSAVSGAILIYYAVLVFRRREGAEADKAARALFRFSILYLFIVFAALLAEHALGLVS